jgi:membrane protease YdiL (CAAX protease family)
MERHNSDVVTDALRADPTELVVLAPTSPSDKGPRGRWHLVLAALVTLLLAAGGATLGGEFGRFVMAGALRLPFIALLLLLQLARVWGNVFLRAASWTWFWALLLTICLGSMMLPTLPGAVGAVGPQPGTLRPLGTGLLFVVVLAAIVLTGGGKWALVAHTWGAHVDARSRTHTQACVGTCVFIAAAFIALIAADFTPPLIAFASRLSSNSGSGANAPSSWDGVYATVWAVWLALLGAGVPVFRSLRESLSRLGVQVPRGRDALVIAAGTIIALVIGVGSAYLTSALWHSLGWRTTDVDTLRELLPNSRSGAFGALTAALGAGIGEELLFRGLLQPRLGWPIATLAFTAAHAYQYAPEALIVTFLLGALFAAGRARWNTSITIAVHSLYDLALFLLLLVEPS